ncbi:MAG: hypothetical protein WEA77_13690 [Hyphomonas sp.]|uniref:hypothetical protein n=1 Tax=Hyphomonas sp. TaxID=87 RepID=UPI0034A055AA
MARATLDYETSNSAIEAFLERPVIRTAITSLIIFNALTLGVLTLGVLTYRAALPGAAVGLLEFLDGAVTAVFVAEIAAKLWV